MVDEYSDMTKSGRVRVKWEDNILSKGEPVTIIEKSGNKKKIRKIFKD